VDAPRQWFASELTRRVDAVLRAHPELDDHRPQFPSVLACLGDPFAPVWFIAENPSRALLREKIEAAAPRLVIFTFEKTAEVRFGPIAGSGLIERRKLDGASIFATGGSAAE
jgi:hypothetical protein